MKINKILIMMSFTLIFLNACSSANKEVKYSSTDKSAISFAKKTVVSLSGYLDKIVTKKNIRESQGNGFKKLTTHFFPRNGIESVKSSFNNYCSGIGGTLKRGLCLYDNEKKGYFFVKTGIIGYVSGTPKVSLVVIEPTTTSPVQMVKIAQANGYLTSAQVKAKNIANQIQLRKLNKAHKARLQRRNIERSMFQRGDRVCSYRSTYPGIIDEVTNKRIKVSLRIGNTNHWYNKNDWYLCEN